MLKVHIKRGYPVKKVKRETKNEIKKVAIVGAWIAGITTAYYPRQGRTRGCNI